MATVWVVAVPKSSRISVAHAIAPVCAQRVLPDTTQRQRRYRAVRLCRWVSRAGEVLSALRENVSWIFVACHLCLENARRAVRTMVLVRDVKYLRSDGDGQLSEACR